MRIYCNLLNNHNVELYICPAKTHPSSNFQAAPRRTTLSTAWLIWTMVSLLPTRGQTQTFQILFFASQVNSWTFCLPSSLDKCLLIWLDQILIRLLSCPQVLALRQAYWSCQGSGCREKHPLLSWLITLPLIQWTLSAWLLRCTDLLVRKLSLLQWLPSLHCSSVQIKPLRCKCRFVFIWQQSSIVMRYPRFNWWCVTTSENK